MHRNPKALSILDQLEIAEPCSESWETMRGDERTRFCDKCRLHVHDLSAMSQIEAEKLVHGENNHVCVRFVRETSGRVQTRKSVGMRLVWFAKRIWFHLLTALGVAGTFGVTSGCTMGSPVARPMGRMRVDAEHLEARETGTSTANGNESDRPKYTMGRLSPPEEPAQTRLATQKSDK